jgi:hypothetical protein
VSTELWVLAVAALLAVGAALYASSPLPVASARRRALAAAIAAGLVAAATAVGLAAGAATDAPGRLARAIWLVQQLGVAAALGLVVAAARSAMTARGAPPRPALVAAIALLVAWVYGFPLVLGVLPDAAWFIDHRWLWFAVTTTLRVALLAALFLLARDHGAAASRAAAPDA